MNPSELPTLWDPVGPTWGREPQPWLARGVFSMNWYTAACPVCSGTVHDDLDHQGWLTCSSCARSFQAQDVRLFGVIQAGAVPVQAAPTSPPQRDGSSFNTVYLRITPKPTGA